MEAGWKLESRSDLFLDGIFCVRWTAACEGDRSKTGSVVGPCSVAGIVAGKLSLGLGFDDGFAATETSGGLHRFVSI